jgi:hypothetical protein
MAILIGGTALGSNGSDFEAAGVVVATKRVAIASGTVDQIQVRTDASTASTMTSLVAAVFADSAGTPGSRIGSQSATLTTGLTATGAWLVLTGLSVAVTNGTTYWLAFLPLGGSFRFSLNDSTTAAGTKDDTGGQAAIPATWAGTVGSFTEIMNAYAESTVAAGSPAPSALVVPNQAVMARSGWW